jgi:hypothetical protein
VIGDDPRRNRQDHVGQEADRAEGTHEGRVAGFAIDHDEDRDDVQPVADPTDELAEQQSDQRPVAEQLSIDAKA